MLAGADRIDDVLNPARDGEVNMMMVVGGAARLARRQTWLATAKLWMLSIGKARSARRKSLVQPAARAARGQGRARSAAVTSNRINQSI